MLAAVLPVASAAAKTPVQPTSTTLSLSAPALAYGSEQTEVFTAEVTAASATPTGSVTVKAGTKKVCTAVLAGGVGRCSPSKGTLLKAGAYTVTASYKGPKTFKTSSSGGVRLTVSTPPTTKITQKPGSEVPSGEVEVGFTSSQEGSTFECSLDGAPYSLCSSPARFSVGPGAHTLSVRAVNSSGLADPDPQIVKWTSVGQASSLELCGTISGSQTLSPADASMYVITCDVTVAPGATLTLAPGTIVKAEDFDSLAVSGSLVAAGTASDPVTFTSIDDDSVGAATGDGTPVAGAWQGIYTQAPEAGDPPPAIELEHADVSYAAGGVSASEAALSVIDSTVSHTTGTGIEADSPVGVPTVEGNTVTNAVSEAVRIVGASIDLASLNGNSGANDGLDGVALGDDTLAVSSSLPWTGNLLPVLIYGCSSLVVPAKVTLTLDPGTIVKGENCTSLDVEGTLDASGTASDPVTFTSWRDDGVGGDTNDDGEATLPAAGDWGGIDTNPPGNGNADPTIDLQHVDVDYSSFGVEADEATTSILDSSVAHTTGVGIVVAQPAGIPTVEGNTVANVAAEAIRVADASIDMGRLNGNSGSNDGLDGVALYSDTLAVSSSLPWSGSLLPVLVSGCDSLTVPAKVTLTLEAGAIVKGENCTSLAVSGSLVANGTASDPVTLTSWRDDSVGGDTNDDGDATLPAAGDWGGIQTNPPGGGNANPTIDLHHVNVDYSSSGIDANEATTSIVDSSVSHVEGEGITVDQPEGIPTVSDNTVTDAQGRAILIQSASIDLDTLNGNSGSGDELNGVALSADTLAVSSSLPWSGSLLPVLVSGCDSLTVPAKVTLTLEAGAIVKGERCTSLEIQGSLVGRGTAGDPVTLTSWRDDSVGGDTNDDGDATLPAAGDWSGIQTVAPGGGNASPTVSLEHVDVDYASEPVRAERATTSITDSSIAHAQARGIYVAEPEGIPTVSGNTVTDVADEAIEIVSAPIDMARLNGNSGSGDGLDGVALSGDELVVSSSLPWTGDLTPVLDNGCQALTVAPKVTLTLEAGTVVKGERCSVLDVEGSLVANGTASDPVTLTSWRDDTVGGDTDDDGGAISPAPGDWGGVETTAPGAGNPNPSITLAHTDIRYATDGLEATEQTSTNVDSSAVEHASQIGVSLRNVHQASFTGDTVSESPVGIALSDASASYRGTLVDDAVGARTDGSSTLDARETNWGSPSGPPPYGEGAPAEGSGIEYFPWAGYTPPAHTEPPPGGWQSPASSCTPVLFLGVRGSGESPSASASLEQAAYASDTYGGLGKEVQMMLDGEVANGGKLGPLPAPAEAFVQALESGGVVAKSIRAEALVYEAASTNDLTDVIEDHDVLGVHIPSISIAGWYEYYESVEGGIEELETELEADEQACPSQKIVLAGYSQGALVIHGALDRLESSDPSVIGTGHIGAVILLADPERVADPEGRVFGTSSWNAEGIYTFFPGITHPDVPESLSAVTASMCDANDFVCDFSFPDSLEHHSQDIAIHTGYIPPSGSENEAEYMVAELGRWAAQTLLANGLPHS